MERLCLKDGSVDRGIVIEMIPGESVQIKIRDGKILIYRLDKIADTAKEALPKIQKKDPWGAFRRSVIFPGGTFPKLSIEHMERHLVELDWRFNNRDNPHILRDTLNRILTTQAMPYRNLVNKVA